MTDKEILINMFKRNNIIYEEDNNDDKNRNQVTTLAVRGGYIGFYSELWFDESDNLIGIGAYE